MRVFIPLSLKILFLGRRNGVDHRDNLFENVVTKQLHIAFYLTLVFSLVTWDISVCYHEKFLQYI